MSIYQNKDAKIRLYDGTTSPFFLELCLDNGDFSGPMGDPVLEERLILDRGKVGACTHYVTGNDAPVMEPVDISFSVMVNDGAKFGYLMDWLEGNQVNGNTIVTTKGDNPRLGSGLSFADTSKKCCNIEYKALVSAVNFKMTYNEVYFDLASLSMAESEEAITVSLTGRCYGTIVRSAADFTTGNDVA